MGASDSFGLVLILVFAGLLLALMFLALRRRSKGVLGSRQLIAGVIITLAIMFVVVRKPLTSYLGNLFRAEPYDFSDLKSVVFRYGVKDSLLNKYDSATGEFDYLDRRDSLIKTHLNLTRNDLIYLHRKATELGFWEFPVNEVNADTTNTNGEKPAEYVIQFNYRQKSKTVTFSANYDGPADIVKENLELIGEIEMVLKGAEERTRK